MLIKQMARNQGQYPEVHSCITSVCIYRCGSDFQGHPYAAYLPGQPVSMPCDHSLGSLLQRVQKGIAYLENDMFPVIITFQILKFQSKHWENHGRLII